MSAKFTKGPWRVANCGVYGADGTEVIAKGLPLAHRQGGSEENSALILASPLLYEALEALEWSQSNHHCCPACGRVQGTGHFGDCKLNTALRAARGEG